MVVNAARAVEACKDNLPKKAKKDTIPQFLWIAPPVHANFHDNSRRDMFGECLTKASKFQKHMSVLKLIKIWEEDNPNDYSYESDRYTATGLAKYWLSVDSAIRYWNVAIFPKIGKPSKANRGRRNDRYHWNKK